MAERCPLCGDPMPAGGKDRLSRLAAHFGRDCAEVQILERER